MTGQDAPAADATDSDPLSDAVQASLQALASALAAESAERRVGREEVRRLGEEVRGLRRELEGLSAKVDAHSAADASTLASGPAPPSTAAAAADASPCADAEAAGDLLPSFRMSARCGGDVLSREASALLQVQDGDTVHELWVPRVVLDSIPFFRAQCTWPSQSSAGESADLKVTAELPLFCPRAGLEVLLRRVSNTDPWPLQVWTELGPTSVLGVAMLADMWGLESLVVEAALVLRKSMPNAAAAAQVHPHMQIPDVLRLAWNRTRLPDDITSASAANRVFPRLVS